MNKPDPAVIIAQTAVSPVCPVGEPQCSYLDEVLALRQQVITDPLTGLFNVRYFRAALEQEMERTERTFMPTALMMVDLDHFKKVNDTFGHETGNDVLQQTARLIRDSTRKLDIQCRYGGEEFAIILPSTERRLAIQVARRLCENIEFTPVMSAGRELRVTASIGLAFYEAGHDHNASALIAAADAFLYEAKHNGRNQVRYEILPVTPTAVTSEEKELLRNLFSNDEAE